MKYYDIMIYTNGTYVCGSYYSTYEYYHKFKELGYNVCFVSHNDLSEDNLRKTLEDRYGDYDKGDMYFFSFTESFSKICPIGCNVLFTTSIFAAAHIITMPILIGCKKIILIHEGTYDEEMIVKAFIEQPSQKKLDKILMLGDMRTFDKLGDYEHIDYNIKIYPDIWRPLEGPVDHCVMINMATKQKCYEPEYLQDLIDFYPNDYLIYTKKQFYEKYKVLESDNVNVKIAPISNFLNRWDRALYLNSVRGQDPSPRVIVECFYYNKELIWHDFGKLKDGAYYRYIDCENNIDELKLKDNDEIFEIVGRYL